MTTPQLNRLKTEFQAVLELRQIAYDQYSEIKQINSLMETSKERNILLAKALDYVIEIDKRYFALMMEYHRFENERLSS